MDADLAAREFETVLGPQGPIALRHPNYEHRPGQIRMAQAVADALAGRHHLCVEAGTGTGKTLAYLTPAIFSGRRVIVSTGTKNLQEQLFFKDIPFLEQALSRKFSACCMKGRGNYLCIAKLAAIDDGTWLFSPDDPKHLRAIRRWARETETGDRAELTKLPDELPLWHRIDARRETCTGQKCPDFASCFVTRVRQRALESDIVIVNHHLFFADLALRQGDFGAVLPDYAAVVFDEAHEIEDVATQYFGSMASSYRMEEWVRDAEKALMEAGGASDFLTGQLARLARASEDFFGAFRDGEGRRPMRELGPGLDARRGPHGDADAGPPYRALASQLGVAGSALASHPQQSESIEALVRRAVELREALGAVLESDSQENVYWYDCRARGVFLWASPICVAPLLQPLLFSKVDTVVLTSATLATGGNFAFIRSRLGLQESRELVLPSHFDFGRQAILYIPRDIPEPREQGWVRQACAQLERILEASRGRAFILFTSYAQMKQVYEALQERLRYPLLMQGAMSKTGLLDAFRRTPGAVLFGTSSFWQGVDVQGEQLSCVVIDKLPFSVPSDPVVAARIRQITESGGNAFYDYQIPEAVIMLKQGLGRLIRSRSDRGILAILDKRLVTRGYGRNFLDSLPPAPLTHNPDDLRNFFAAGPS